MDGNRRHAERTRLSLEYGVARNTIRRAIESLTAQGLVTRHVGRGTLIAEAQPSQTPDEAKDLVQIVRNLAGTSPLDIMNMRLIIEPQAAARRRPMPAPRNLRPSPVRIRRPVLRP